MPKPALSEDIRTKVDKWLKEPFDLSTQSAVQELLTNNKEKLIDAFYTNLSFGTAGMRGIMGVGTNRINIYTIRAATQGLSNYINKSSHENKSVVIGHDNRHNSKEFAIEAAKVLAGNRIHVYLTKELRPTPFVSFMCREKGATAAIMITASHNPPEYNGFKVYWSDGSQVVPPQDAGIIEEVKKIHDISHVKSSKEKSEYITTLNENDDNSYVKAIEHLQNYPKLTQEMGNTLSIVYSPLHGAGSTLMEKTLMSWGFSNLKYVEKQRMPSGDFPFAKSPNPEEKHAMQLGMDLLKEVHGDLFIATDPDADRIGACILREKEARLITGNQIATLCAYHLLNTYKKQNRLSKRHVIISTIVTTRILSKMCLKFNIKYLDTLTGFKYIGEKIKNFEEMPDGLEFLFGAEESYGFLYGTHARDKDALVTACLLAEIALIQKKKNETLYDLLEEIYAKYGFYHEKQLAIKFPDGQRSIEEMKTKIQALRDHPPKALKGIQIIKICDYQSSTSLDCLSGKREKISLSKSNVLSYLLEDGSEFIIRPSGTEPKIKIYAMGNTDKKGSMSELKKKLDRSLDQTLSFIKDTYFTS